MKKDKKTQKLSEQKEEIAMSLIGWKMYTNY